jgi:hypothetical protein
MPVCPLLKQRRGRFERNPHAPGQRYADECPEDRGFPVQAAFADAERAGCRAHRAFGADRLESRVWVIAYLVSATALHSVAVAAHRSSRGVYRSAEEIDLQSPCKHGGATARPAPLFADKQ